MNNMETTFKISRQLREYIQIQYVANLTKLPIMCNDYVWVNSAKEGRKFITLVRELEQAIQLELSNKGLDLDVRLIIFKYLEAIGSIASGIDIRSGMPVEELADRFVFGYNNAHCEAVKYCEETMEFYETNKETTSYMENWKRYDKYNECVKKFLLDFKELGTHDFNEDPLGKMLELSQQILDTLIEERKIKINKV